MSMKSYDGGRIENPATGQAITFLESGSGMLRLEAELQPGARTPPHLHPAQQERFEVLEGRVSFWLDRERRELGPGETLSVPAGAGHRFRNDGTAPARLRSELCPALDAQALFEVLFALGRAGRTRGRIGAPGPLQTAVLIGAYGDSFFFPAGPPPSLVKVLAAPLASLGRALGRPARAEEIA